MHAESEVRIPLVTGGKTVHDVSEDIAGRVEERPSITWMLAMAVSLAQKEEEINQKNTGWESCPPVAQQIHKYKA